MADGEIDSVSAGSANSKILKSAGFSAIERAEQSVISARMQAEGIIATAHAEAFQIREAAEREGREAVAALVGEYLARMQRDISERQERLVDLIGTCLRRLIEPIPPHELIVASVTKAFAESHPGARATLTVSPRLVQTLQAHFEGKGITAEMLAVKGDPDCAIGSSTLHCDFGDIELAIEPQIVALEQGMRLALAQSAQ